MIIKGDITGDGRVTTEDWLYIVAKNIYDHPLNQRQSIAADVDNNGEVDDLDGLMIKRHFLGAEILTDYVYGV